MDIGPATSSDAPAIAEVIAAAVRERNAPDYPPSVIARVLAHFTPLTVESVIASRTVLVARIDGRVVGTASLDGAVVRSVYVDPRCERLGVGRALMVGIHRLAAQRALPVLTVPASLTARGFYERLGYRWIRDRIDHDPAGDEKTLIMERTLVPADADPPETIGA